MEQQALSSSEAYARAIREADWQGDFRGAYRLADDAITQYPESVELWALASRLFLWTGRREDAHAALAKARELEPEAAMTWAAEAEVASFEGQSEEAKTAAARAIALDDRDPWVLQNVQGAYAMAGEQATAFSLAQRWRELYPDDIQAICAQFAGLWLAGKATEAEEALAAATSRFPDSPLLWVRQARVLMRRRRLEEAVELFKRAADQLDGNFQVWGELAAALSHLGRYEEAEVAARHAIEITPCATLAFSAMATVYRRRGQDREAAEWRDKASNVIPALRILSYRQEVNAAMLRGDWAAVLAAAEKSPPDVALGLRCLALETKAEALIQLKRLEEAAEVIAELEQAERTGLRIVELRGLLQEARGDFTGAADTLRAGILEHPDSGELRAKLVRCLHALKAKDELAALIDDSRSHLPQSPVGFTTLVMALDEAGHAQEAREFRSLGLERFPNDQALSLMVAMEKLAAGDTFAARKLMKGVKGELRGAAGLLNRAATRMESFQALLRDRLRKRKPDDQSPVQ